MANPPDVYKILKDLELKSVGLDPNTNTMQSGLLRRLPRRRASHP